MLKRIFFSLMLCAMVTLAHGQGKAIVVQVNDSVTGAPVEMANVFVEELQQGHKHYQSTDAKGCSRFVVDGAYRVTVTFLGYSSYIETVKGGGDCKVQLKPESFSMNDVVITGYAAPVRSDKSIYKVNVIKPDQQQGRAATNMHQLLMSESGIRLNTDMSLGSSITMGGLSGQYVKVLIDGVPMTGRMNGNIDLSQIDISNVDHVEIVEGPLSVIYGSGALAGTINIITKEKKLEGVEGSADAYLESVGITSDNLALKYKHGDHNAGITGGIYYFDGWDNVDTLSRSVKWKPKLRYNGSLYYAFNYKNMKLKYTSSLLHEKLTDWGEPYGVYGYEAFDSDYVTQRFDNVVDASHHVADAYKVDWFASYNMYKRTSNEYYVNFKDHTERLDTSLSTHFNQFASRLNYASEHSGRLNYSFGYDMTWENSSGDKIEDDYQDIGDYAAYMNLMYQPVKQVVIQPGVRYIYNTDFDAPFVYSLSLLYSPVAHWQTRVSYAKGFRAPTLKEMYLYFKDSNHSITGNPNLKAENSHSVYLNSTYTIVQGKFAYEFSGKLFYNELDNMIELLPVGAIDGPYTYFNINKAKTQGFGADFKFNHHLRYQFTAGFTTSGRWDNELEAFPDQNHFYYFTDVTSSFTYRFLRPDLNMNIYYKFNGEQKQYVAETNTNGTSSLETTTIMSYHLMDISLSKMLLNKQLTVTGGVKNLFDVTDVAQTSTGNAAVGVHSGSAGDASSIAFGRTFFISLKYQFQKN